MKSDDMTVRQAAQRLGITLKYMRELLYENRMAGARKVGRQWLIPNSAVESHLKARAEAALHSLQG